MGYSLFYILCCTNIFILNIEFDFEIEKTENIPEFAER